MRMQLACICLKVSDLKRSVAFYHDALGMQQFGAAGEGENIVRLAYGDCDARIELRAVDATNRTGGLADRRYSYWKTGIALADVNLACDRLRNSGVSVSEAAQFYDIGYMAHCSDPDGMVLELLQHQFAQNFRGCSPLSHGLGSVASVGQLTLRVRDIDASLKFYTEVLGLGLLSRQRVEAYNFTLYFLADTAELPTVHDDVVAEREWLWQRPYTTLELQHFDTSPEAYLQTDSNQPGFDHAVFTAATTSSNTISCVPGHVADVLVDPDGNQIKVI